MDRVVGPTRRSSEGRSKAKVLSPDERGPRSPQAGARTNAGHRLLRPRSRPSSRSGGDVRERLLVLLMQLYPREFRESRSEEILGFIEEDRKRATRGAL